VQVGAPRFGKNIFANAESSSPTKPNSRREPTCPRSTAPSASHRTHFNRQIIKKHQVLTDAFYYANKLFFINVCYKIGKEERFLKR